jgi:hypothetical protein
MSSKALFYLTRVRSTSTAATITTATATIAPTVIEDSLFDIKIERATV